MTFSSSSLVIILPEFCCNYIKSESKFKSQLLCAKSSHMSIGDEREMSLCLRKCGRSWRVSPLIALCFNSFPYMMIRIIGFIEFLPLYTPSNFQPPMALKSLKR